MPSFLFQASRYYETAFLLALAMAKRSNEIHTPAMDSDQVRFNQSDGSVSLTLQTGFLAKNQLLSICPDPIVIPNLAQNCLREHLDKVLCPIRAFFKVLPQND